MKTVEETSLVLDQVRYYDNREVTPALINGWHHALLRLTIEAAFDAVHTHFENCGALVPLIAGHVLEHASTARRAQEDADRKLRDKQRNEAVFGALHDPRDQRERDAALAAMRAGRAELDAILTTRRTGDTT